MQKMHKNLTELSILEFSALLASSEPAPGGGSVAALSGSLGAALVSMVCSLTIGREKYKEFEKLAADTLKSSNELMLRLQEGVQRDTDAFNELMAAFALPKDSDAERASRSEAIQKAYRGAVDSPLDTMENCLAVMKLAKGLLFRCNKNAASDLAVASLQAWSGVQGALENVRINLPSIKDTKYTEEVMKRELSCSDEAEKLLFEIRKGVREMLEQK